MTVEPRRVRAALPVPAGIRAWPAAVRPGRAIATASGLELIYRSPKAGEVRILLDEDGRAQTLVPGRDRILAARLTSQVNARGRALPAATLTSVQRVTRALRAVEGDAPLQGALAVFRWLCAPVGPAPESGEDDETVAALGVQALRAGDLAGALRALDRRRAVEGPATVGDVLLLAFAGLGVHARAQLCDPSRLSPMSAIAWENVAIALQDWEAAHRFSRAHTPTDDPARLVVAMHLALEAREYAWAGRAGMRVLMLDATDEQKRAALLGCIQSGHAEAAAEWLRRAPSPTPELMLSAAEIAVHRLHLQEAAQWLSRLGELGAELHLRRERARGALALADARYDDAVTCLEPVLEAWPRDRETTILLGEAHLRAGRRRAGMDVLERFNKKVTGEHPAAKLLLGLGSLPGLYEAPGMERAPGSTLYLHRNIAFDLLGEKPSFGRGDMEDEAAFILRALDVFGGNRSDTLTVLDGDELRSAKHVQDPRVHVVEVQHAVLTEPVESVRARLRALGAERADVPYPRTYEAEIDLWRGDYAKAAALFEEVYTETGTRWGYVGWGASLAMLGQCERAIEVLDEGVRRIKGAIDGEATPAYRGEALLGLGRVDEAVADLKKATSLRPLRLGAWATLALALRQAGDADGATAARDRFLDAVPVLAWEAQKVLGLPPALPVPDERRWGVLETARDRMLGSRSSYLLTFYDADDVWRVHQIVGHLERTQEMAARVSNGVTASALESFLARHHGSD